MLDRISLQILKIYDSRRSLSCNQLGAILDVGPLDVSVYVIGLRDKGLLRIEPNHAASQGLNSDSSFGINTPLQITLDGKAELDAAQEISHEKRVQQIRYMITTGIAVIALFLSIISLLLQAR